MVENKLFNEKIMNNFISKYEKELIPNKKVVQIWIEKLNNNELKNEVKNYSKFTTYILNDLLGYTPEDYIDQESIGDEKRPVDYVLLQDGKKFVAVELKGTNTPDITKRHNRENSAVEQACLYATEQAETKWAIASNYDEFRLFDPKSRNDYISFKFRELTDVNILKKFLLCFSKFSLIDENIPQKLTEQSTIIERKFEDEFYNLFAETRLMLIKELESSDEIDRLKAIRLAQLILNRYIFICFAEDLGLLPALTSTNTIMTPIENANLRKNTIWNRLNELFIFVNEGNPQKGIGEFNGGLFAEELDDLKIRDMVDDLTFFDDCYKKWKFEEQYKKIEPLIENYKDNLNPIYKNLLTISEFDFESQLDVNILGHIFENSIGDIEELKNEDKSRRKKDGVFYTPEYITDYISRNTIIPYLSKSGEANTVEELISEYNLSTSELEKLDEKLKNIKIIDPACGSGAFLNKAADILLEIHEHYHAARYANSNNNLDKWFDSVNSRREILINNIYGVDLNPESVEITKLALFLKVANNEMKLPNLDKNIKCGNSLIDDESIVGNDAFNWESEFKEIFENGRFDIVIGNPPYGAKIPKEQQNFLNNTYISGGSETAISFIKLSYDKLLKNEGKMSFIIPKSFTFASNYIPLQKYIIKYIETVIDCGKVWKNVKLEQVIFILNKNKTQNYYIEKVRTHDTFKFIDTIDKNSYDEFKLILNGVNRKDIKIAQKIKVNNFYLNDVSTNSRGGIFQKRISEEGDYNVLGGSEIQREGITGIKGKVEKKIVNNMDKAFIHKNSILVQRIISHITKPTDYIKITACIPNDNHYVIVDTINQITINEKINKYLIWSLLNSKLINWYAYRFIFAKAIRTMQFDNPTTSRIPIPKNILINEKTKEINNNAKKLNENYNKLKLLKNKFYRRLNEHFELITINKQLQNFENITFKQFNKNLSKQKIKLSLKKEDEWEEYFDYYKNNCLKIKNENEILKNKIDKEIYKLYDLTEEEIQIIEKTFNGD